MIKPTIRLQELQAKIGLRAKSAPTHRFWGLHVHLVKLDTLKAAYREAKRNRGAPGADGVTFKQIEAAGPAAFLQGIAAELSAGTYRPLPYRQREIPKEGGKVRVISIPAIRDRVVQGALRILLEPIFEADFSDSSYGARPGRSAHQAIGVVRRALHLRRHRVVDVDLSRYFDSLRHDRLLEKVARRVSDGKMLALIKQFLKSTGKRGVPQGSPLSPLLANLALNSLDQALDRGSGYHTYVRYLDDMVVLVPNTQKGRAWAERALSRIQQEAEALGVTLNAEKTRSVSMAKRRASFAFLGFELRWRRSPKTRRRYADVSPRAKKVTDVLRRVGRTLRGSRALTMRAAVQRVNQIVRGWVIYFRIGHSHQAFSKVRYHVECKVRRFAAKKSKRRGHGWERWSSEVVYNSWGLFADYRVVYTSFAKVGDQTNGIITSREDASAASRMREIRLSGSRWRGPETESRTD